MASSGESSMIRTRSGELSIRLSCRSGVLRTDCCILTWCDRHIARVEVAQLLEVRAALQRLHSGRDAARDSLCVGAGPSESKRLRDDARWLSQFLQIGHLDLV